jgi:hypothetical protein
MMKSVILLVFFLSVIGLPDLLADAGFNIRRKHATVRVVFQGAQQLHDYRLVYYRWTTRFQDELPPLVNRDVLDTINDASEITINNARKYFDESDRHAQFGLIDPQGNWVDSFRLYLREVNYHVRLTGVQQSKLQYQLDSTPVVFEYALWHGEDVTTDAAYTRNRWIFIGASLMGLLLLVWYSMRKDRASSQQSSKV